MSEESTDAIESLSLNMRGTCQQIAGHVRRHGGEVSELSRENLQMVRAYADALLNGESVDPADISNRVLAFVGRVKPSASAT